MNYSTCPQCGAALLPHGQACQACGRSIHGAALPLKKQGMSTTAIVLIVLAVTIVPILGIFSTLAIYGVRKYIANAKTAEAKNVLHEISLGAVKAYEENHRVCLSASAPVPREQTMIRGQKYQSSTAEWQVDQKSDRGFSCLQFELRVPQYFQYEYEATPAGFVARAHGDLNGDGTVSTFEIQGRVENGQLVVAPSIAELNPEE